MSTLTSKNSISTFHNFLVANSAGVPVTGLVNANFTKLLFNPSHIEVSGSIPVTVTELSGGAYFAEFTPNVIGTWFVVIFNAANFPQGQGGEVQVFVNDIDSVGGGGGPTAGDIADAVWDEAQADHVAAGSVGKALDDTNNNSVAINGKIDTQAAQLIRILGLNHENFVMDPVTFDVNGSLLTGIVRLYDSKANADTDDGATGLIHTYNIKSVRTTQGFLGKYTQTRES